MAAPLILVEASPRRASDAAVVSVNLAGAGGKLPYPSGYRAGVAGLPTIMSKLDFADQEMGGGGVPQATGVNFAPALTSVLADIAGHYWRDAAIAVRIGPEGAGAPPIALSGTVLEATVDGGVLKIALADPAAALKRPMLVDRFAGTGGVEGPAELAGVAKPRAWGACFNVPGRPLDPANNIVCFGDPSRRWQAFMAVRDRGAPASASALTVLGWQGSAAATFAALQAATAPQGGGVLAPDIACVKWWAEPGDLTADIRGEIAGGYVETAPEIAARIVAARSQLGFAPGTIAAAVAARPAAYGRRVDDETTTAADLLSAILGDVSTSWLLDAGAIVLRPWEWSAPATTAKSVAVTRRETLRPIGTRKLGYRRNHHKVTRGDLAAIVFASDGRYADGTSFEAWKPAQPGADVTGTNTASAIAGQGPGATAPGAQIFNSFVQLLANGSLLGGGGGQVTYSGIGGGALGLLSSLFYGSPSFLEYAGGPAATLAGFKTALGTAQAIVGQAPTATSSDFSVITGSTRPEANATTGANLIPDARRFGRAVIRSDFGDGSIIFERDGAANGPNRDNNRIRHQTTSNATWLCDAVTVVPGETLYFATEIGQLSANGECYMYVFFYRGDGSQVGSAVIPNTRTDSTALATNSWRYASGAVVAPVGSATARAGTAREGGTSGYWWFANPYMGRQQPGATLGADVAANVTDGGALLPRNSLITLLGTASAVSGQGAFATLSSAAYGSSLLTGFGQLSPLSSIALGSTYLRRTDGTTAVTESAVVTFLGTAAAIVGQGAFATKNTADYQADVSGAGKPELYATRGDNIVPDPLMEQGASKYLAQGNITFVARRVAGDPGYGFFSIAFNASALLYVNSANPLPITLAADRRVHFAAQVFHSDRVSGWGQAYLDCFNSVGANIGQVTGPLIASAFNQWTPVSTWLTVPAGTVSIIASYDRRTPNNGGASSTVAVSAIRVATTEASATLGAVIGSNLRDLDGVGLPPRTDLLTPLGTAAGIFGQAPTATSSDFSVVTGATKPANNATLGAIIGSNLRDLDGVGLPSRTDLITPLGTAQAIVGQGPGATASSLSQLNPTEGGKLGGIAANATADMKLTPIGTATVSGNTITSNSNVDGGDGAQTVERVNGACVAGCILQARSTYIALVSTAGDGFACNIGGDGQVRAYTGPAQTGYGVVGAATVGDALLMTQDETRVRIFKNGVLLFTAPDTIVRGRAWYASFSCGPRVTVGGVFFRAGTDNAWGSVAGAGRPTDNADVTAVSTAAGIAGQGAFATLSSAPFGSPLLTGFGAVAGRDYLTLGAGTGSAYIADQNDSYVLTNANTVTAFGTAQAIAGQGTLATAPALNRDNVMAYFAYNTFSLNYTITRSDGTSTVTEAMSITSLGVAAAIVGQGGLATKSQAGAGDLTPSAVQQIAYTVLQATVSCPVGN